MLMYAVKHGHNTISKAIPTTIFVQPIYVVHPLDTCMGQLLDILFRHIDKFVKISVLFLARGNGTVQ